MNIIKTIIKYILLWFLFGLIWYIWFKTYQLEEKVDHSILEYKTTFKNCYVITSKIKDDNNNLYIKCWQGNNTEFHEVQLAFVDIPNFNTCEWKKYRKNFFDKYIKTHYFSFNSIWSISKNKYYWFIILNNWENYNKKLLRYWYAKYNNPYYFDDFVYDKIQSPNNPYKSCK